MALQIKLDFHANQEPSMTDSSKSALSLISTHQGYSESEQRIVDYILEHQSEAPRLTAAQLSRAAATSEATVSRFCR